MRKESLLSRIVLAALLLQGMPIWRQIFQGSSVSFDCYLLVIQGYMVLISSVFVVSGKTHDDTLLAKFETVYTGSGDHGSSMVSNWKRMQTHIYVFYTASGPDFCCLCSLFSIWSKDFLCCRNGCFSTG